MIFNLEKMDLTEVKSLYILRGYENEGDPHYCTSMVLCGNDKDEFDVRLFISKKLLTIRDGKNLWKYLKWQGMKLCASVLRTDFDKFYNSRAFKRITLESDN